MPWERKKNENASSYLRMMADIFGRESREKWRDAKVLEIASACSVIISLLVYHLRALLLLQVTGLYREFTSSAFGDFFYTWRILNDSLYFVHTCRNPVAWCGLCPESIQNGEAEQCLPPSLNKLINCIHPFFLIDNSHHYICSWCCFLQKDLLHQTKKSLNKYWNLSEFYERFFDRWCRYKRDF